ncbi:MAG: LytTR family DNA-binding domain-containing protein [Clostridiales bacterium]|nr:LytTR family DNA-binding domain-containing protein [Clostridiales bacterium]
MRTAIVEDEQLEGDRLKQYCANYEAEKHRQIVADSFSNPVAFLEQYNPSYDLVLLDIQMPGMNGMRLAERLRELDSEVLIAFVTNMAQYAVQGYRVAALDFILKPVSYFQFSQMMDRVFRCLEQRRPASLIVTSKRDTYRIPVADICYIESQNHKLLIHMEGDVLEAWTALTAVEESLPPHQFSRVNAGMLVNLGKVAGVRRDNVQLLSGEELPIARRRKKEFCADLAYYYGEKSYV